jgi:hypothetical protein
LRLPCHNGQKIVGEKFEKVFGEKMGQIVYALQLGGKKYLKMFTHLLQDFYRMFYLHEWKNIYPWPLPYQTFKALCLNQKGIFMAVIVIPGDCCFLGAK